MSRVKNVCEVPSDVPQRASLKRKRDEAQTSDPFKCCRRILTKLLSKKQERYAVSFYKPVCSLDPGFHDYHNIIKEPMDLSTIKNKMDEGKYADTEGFFGDMRLMFANCFKYYPPTHKVIDEATELQEVFEKSYGNVCWSRYVSSQLDIIEDKVKAITQEVERLSKEVEQITKDEPKKKRKTGEKGSLLDFIPVPETSSSLDTATKCYKSLNHSPVFLTPTIEPGFAADAFGAPLWFPHSDSSMSSCDSYYGTPMHDGENSSKGTLQIF